MNIWNKLERKFGKFYIRNLITYIISFNAIIYIMMYTSIGKGSILNLVLVPELVLKGEIWRLLTFIFIPPMTSPLFIVFALYFYYIAGISLERELGGFKFNIYYLIGVLSTIIISFLTDTPATAAYINLSLFLAFAKIAPDFELLFLFIIPVKVKYLAMLNWGLIIWNLITVNSIGGKLLVLAPVINYLIFFGKDILKGTVSTSKNYYRKKSFENKVKKSDYRHRCAVCGITDLDDPNMEFRYCSKCSGNKCYCMNHIKNHEHK
ncbi:rhomboid family intramembrane serine protease [Clostridium perfringens]